MRQTLLALPMLLLCAAPASAGEAVVDSILGGAAGGLVLGPVGLVGGALIGATAGPGISQSWGLSGHGHAHRPRAKPRPQQQG
jgi:hypothetical protein